MHVLSQGHYSSTYWSLFRNGDVRRFLSASRHDCKCHFQYSCNFSEGIFYLAISADMFRRPLTRIELVLDDKREYEKLQREQESRRNAAGTSTTPTNGKTDAKVEHRRKKRTIEDRIGMH